MNFLAEKPLEMKKTVYYIVGNLTQRFKSSML